MFKDRPCHSFQQSGQTKRGNLSPLFSPALFHPGEDYWIQICTKKTQIFVREAFRKEKFLDLVRYAIPPQPAHPNLGHWSQIWRLPLLVCRMTKSGITQDNSDSPTSFELLLFKWSSCMLPNKVVFFAFAFSMSSIRLETFLLRLTAFNRWRRKIKKSRILYVFL